MKTKLIDFIHNLILYDYLLFGGIILLFILLLVLAVIARERLVLAIVLVFLAFGILTGGSFFGYTMLHKYLFKHTISVSELKALEFTKALLIKGEITNRSKRTFQECTLDIGVHKVTHNRYVDPLYPYFPFKKTSISVKQEIGPGENASFKLFVEPFRYTKEYNITIKGSCR